MGQAGAQREPSMEEILASIRRIIENNEPAQDEGQAVAGDANGHHYDGNEAYSEDHGAVEADEPDHIEANEPAPRPISLADVAALARAIPDNPQMRDHSQGAEKPQLQEVDLMVEETMQEDGSDLEDVAAAELRDALLSDEPVSLPQMHADRSLQPEHDEPADRNEQGLQHEEITKSEREVKSAETTASKERQAHNQQGQDHQESAGQLVSLHTGEKVAASFGELDAAIAAGQNRSFDEIAEEMLRPMLTQWLDDNLPTLVERLVREEIERVSRGNRR